jgi:TonB family protein
VPLKKFEPSITVKLPDSASKQVVVNVLVGVDGKVKDARVTFSENPQLNESATEAARKWEFVPASFDNRRIEIWYAIVFTIQSGRERKHYRLQLEPMF